MSSIYVNAIAGQSWRHFGYDSHITYFFDDAGWRPWTIAEMAGYEAAAQAWANVANITFQQVGPNDIARFEEKLVTTGTLAAESGPGTLARHYVPNPFGFAFGEYAADGNAHRPHILGYRDPRPGSAAFETFVHEIGHGLGLAHPHDTGQGTTVFPGLTPDGKGGFDPFSLGTDNMNQNVVTVMSYNEFRSPGDFSGHVAGPMAIDIAAIQQLYGANRSYHAGDDFYSLDYVLGVGASSARWVCIWDAGGHDVISYSGSRAVTIDLRSATLQPGDGAAGYLSEASRGGHGGITIAHGVTIENASSGNGGDFLIGNGAGNTLDGGGGRDKLYGITGRDTLAGGNGRDELYGGAGRDTLDGGAGGDKLFGGAGHDTFRFDNVTDPGLRLKACDAIGDFQHRHDKLDFSGVDADAIQADDQAFGFIGRAKFSGVAGQVHFLLSKAADGGHGVTVVEGDVNGDGAADFRVKLAGLVHLTAVDFIL